MKKYTYRIEQDNNPESPREWDNLGRMVCFHNRYNLGDKTDYKSSQFDSWDELKDKLIEDGAVEILPLYLYDHSGITISTKPFGCQWDSGQVGFIYCTENDIKIMGCDREKLAEYLKGEVETYDKYLTGEIYGYRIIEETTCDLGHTHENELDSCWGYYGEEDAIAEAESIVKYYRTGVTA